MKGLIIKDILNLRNYMKQLILVFIFFVAYGIFLKKYDNFNVKYASYNYNVI